MAQSDEEQELATAPTGPLAGVRVFDMTSVVFGAYATQILGDLGADVIKLEFPGNRPGMGGDIMRWAGAAPENAPAGWGPIYVTINRNKRSWLLDLREDAARAELAALIPTCDVFVSTVRMDGMERIGLDEASVRALRPDIIYVHGSGYGAEGPYAGQPAYDDLVQASSGLADLIPRLDDGPPRYLPTLIADKVSGLFMVQAVTAALYHHERTGEGQFVEVPMLECLVGFNSVENMFGQVFDPPTGPFAYPRIVTPKRMPYRTADGYLGIMPYSDAQWLDFFRLAGATDRVLGDPQFADFKSRTVFSQKLYELVEELTPLKTTAEWLDLLRPVGIPVATVNRLDDLIDDPHLREVGMFPRYRHPDAGVYRAPRSPFRFSRTPVNVRRHPPGLGEHSEELSAEARLRMEQK